MKNSFIRFFGIIVGLLSAGAYAVDCSNLDTWQSSDIYVGGAQVQYNGNAYQANYWTQNNNPEQRSGQWEEWKLLGSCDGSGPTPTPVPTSNPTPTPNPNPGGDCGSLPRYAAGTSYSAGQEVVNFVDESNQDAVFVCDIAGWCSSSAAWAYEPGNGAHWTQAWSKTRDCSGGGGNAQPIANANGPYSGMVGDYIQFSSAGSSDPDGVIASYEWSFGDGQTASDPSPAHAYSSAGNYNVVLTVTDDMGASASSSASVSVTDGTDPTPIPTPTPVPPPPGDKKVIGYFVQWGVYSRNYHVKNIVTSGSAEKLTHIVYAFGNVTNGQCVIGDSYADYDRFYDADLSVDGQPDTWDAGALRGSFNQLRKLKQMYPHIKVLWSFGGWTWSGGFGQAAANPEAFADSCYNLVHDPRWDGVFDGIDIDWEYPNECGLTCDTSGFNAYGNLMQALRNRFGNELVTAAIGAGEAKLNAANYGAASAYVDFYMLMTYDFFGAFNPQGPTAPHSSLYNFPSIPTPGFYSDNAVQVLKSKGVAADKILLGIGFYGRGWTGVSQSAPGGSASGAATGTYEPGIEDYKVLKNTCPSTGTIAGTAYAHCGNNWWSYDTPSTINGKMGYANSENLGGAFFWELSGDTTDGELIRAISDGL